MSHITNTAHTVNTEAQPFQPDEYIPGYASKLLRRSEYFFALGVLTTGSPSFFLGRAKMAKRLGCSERTVSREVTRLEAFGYYRRGGQDCPRFGQWGGMLILPGPKMWGLIRDKVAALLSRGGFRKSPKNRGSGRGTRKAHYPHLYTKVMKRIKENPPKMPPAERGKAPAGAFAKIYARIRAGPSKP